MIKEFYEWFTERVEDIKESITEAARTAVAICIVVITLPIWIGPLVYWYFTKWRGKDNAKEE